jgi:hypothetical protein
MPNSCAKSPHAAPSRSQGVLSASAPQRCFCEPGHLTASETKRASPGRPRNSSGDRELAFFGHPLESFCRAFDPVLAVVSVGRQQAEHLVGAAGGRTGNVASSKIYSLSNAEFVLQRPLHHAKTPVAPTVPAATSRLETGGGIARRRRPWPATSGHGKRAFFAGFSAR